MITMSWLPTPTVLLTSLLLSATAVTALANDAPLAPYHADYEVLRNGKAIGSSRSHLERNGDTWTWRSNTAGERGMAWMVGLKVDQTMTFRWLDGLPQPLRSTYEQQATLGNRSVEANYDWTTGRYQLRDRKGNHTHVLADGATDRYGSGVSVAAMLARGETDFVLKVAHADGLRDWRFRVTGEETVETAEGAVRTLRVERVREDDDRSTVTWLDPARNYVVVRMLQVEDGDSTESRLRNYQAN